MPYADVEKRRAFHRRYKREWRKRQAGRQRLLGYKIFLCMRYPNFHIAGTSFYNSFLITDDPEVQADVVAHELFGKDIFALAIDFTCAPTEDESV
jgi:hypothetical protein